MGLRCLLSHDFGEPELEREREEQGNEVVITVNEVKTCSRCGERRIVSENTEVTSIEQLTATAAEADAPDASAADAAGRSTPQQAASSGPAESTGNNAGDDLGVTIDDSVSTTEDAEVWTDEDDEPEYHRVLLTVGVEDLNHDAILRHCIQEGKPLQTVLEEWIQQRAAEVLE